MSKIIFSKFSTERLEKYQLRTDIMLEEDGTYCVRKVPASETSYEHIVHMRDTYEVLQTLFQGSFIQYNACTMKQNAAYFEYLEGDNLNDLLIQNMKAGNKQEVCRWMDLFFGELNRIYPSEPFTPSMEFKEIFGEAACEHILEGAKYLNIDMIFSNIIIKDGVWNVFDYEWVFDFLIPVHYVIYRVIHQLAIDCNAFDRKDEYALLNRYGIPESECEIYIGMEAAFQKYVRGQQQGIDNLAHIWNNKYNMSAKKLRNALSYQVYFDYGEGFSEKNSYRVEYENFFDTSVEVTIPVPRDTVALRFDPCDDACLLNLKRVYGITQKDKQLNLAFEMNGRAVRKNALLFKQEDPMLCFDCLHKDIKEIHLAFSIVAGRDSLIHILDKEVSELEDTIGQLQSNHPMKTTFRKIANKTIHKGKQ